MKKILHVCSYGTGGIQNVVYSICKNTYQKNSYCIFGYDVANEDSNVRRYHDLGIETITVPANTSRFGYIKAYSKALDRIKPDCVHLHQFYSSGIMALIARRKGIKQIIVQSHNISAKGSDTLKYRIYKRIMKGLIRRNATDFVAVSSAAGQELFGGKNRFDDRYRIILNGIDTKRFDRQTATKYKHKFIDKNSKIIVSVGRLTKQKNFKFALNVMNEIVRKDDTIKLLIAGDGEERQELAQFIIDNNLQNNVDILGFIEDIPALFNAADLFFLPSLWEGLPLVFLEAQVFGLKCLGSENIPKETNIGLMHFFGLEKSQDEWAKKCIELVNTENGGEISESAKIKASTEYMAEQYQALYDRKEAE